MNLSIDFCRPHPSYLLMVSEKKYNFITFHKPTHIFPNRRFSRATGVEDVKKHRYEKFPRDFRWWCQAQQQLGRNFLGIIKNYFPFQFHHTRMECLFHSLRVCFASYIFYLFCSSPCKQQRLLIYFLNFPTCRDVCKLCFWWFVLVYSFFMALWRQFADVEC